MMREAGLVVARTLRVARGGGRPGISTAELDAHRRARDPRGGRHPVLQGLPRLPRHDLHLGERRDRARHPEPGSGGCGRGHRLHRLRRHRGRLARGRGRHRRRGADHRRARRPAGGVRGRAVARAGAGRGRAAGSATSRTRSRRASAPAGEYGWSRSTPGTASAPRCTWTRRCRTTAGRAAGRGCWPGMALAIEPMLMLGGPDTGCSTTAGRSSPPTAAGPRTSSTRWRSPPTGPGC